MIIDCVGIAQCGNWQQSTESSGVYRVMRQFRFRFVHVLLLLISLAFYVRVRRVANIQDFLAQQSANLGSQEQLAEYERQFKEVQLQSFLLFEFI